MAFNVALVTHTTGGGVWSVTQFLENVILQSGRYFCEVIVLATSKDDPCSVRLFSPYTWLRGPLVKRVLSEKASYWHVGAVGVEFEFQRYRPRGVLTELLNQYDLVQVVAGEPAWAGVTRAVPNPVCLFAATTAQQETHHTG
jgi:hypothetical protein